MSLFSIDRTAVADTVVGTRPMAYARLLITAGDRDRALVAARSLAVAGAGCEAAIERAMRERQTPDGRPGCSVLLFAEDAAALAPELVRRVAGGPAPCPTVACFDGLPEAARRIPLGTELDRDGLGTRQVISGEAFVRRPTADGEFLLPESVGVADGVGGANLVIGAAAADRARAAAAAALEAMRARGIALPGGVRRIITPERDAPRLAPTLRARVPDTLVPERIGALLQIVADTVGEAEARNTLRRGLHAAAGAGAEWITATDLAGGREGRRIPLTELRDPP